MQSGRNSGLLQEGRSKHWPCRKPTQRQAWPAGDQAWFNSRIFAGDKSGVAGVELATASEPPSAPASDLGASPALPRTYSVCGFKVSLQVFLLLEFDLARFAGLR